MEDQDAMSCHDMSVGDNIKKARLNKGLSQDQVAETSGIPLSTYKKYENGSLQPTAGPIRAIAKALAISTDEILLDPDERSVRSELSALFSEVGRMSQAEQAEIKRAVKGLLLVMHQDKLG